MKTPKPHCSTRCSGNSSVQIRKYAEINGREDLQALFREISALTKQVREKVYRLLTEEFGYFE